MRKEDLRQSLMNFVVQVCGKLLIRKFELISLVPVPFAEEPESAARKMIFPASCRISQRIQYFPAGSVVFPGDGLEKETPYCIMYQ